MASLANDGTGSGRSTGRAREAALGGPSIGRDWQMMAPAQLFLDAHPEPAKNSEPYANSRLQVALDPEVTQKSDTYGDLPLFEDDRIN